MAMLKCCSVTTALVVLTVGALGAPQGQNQYLPPTAGYDYPKPSVPFPPPTRPPPTLRPPTPTYNDGGTLLPTYVTTKPPGGDDHHHDHHHEPGMPFDFQYAVKDATYGTDYSHSANSDGDVVKGEYRVQLPDGRLQVVRYTADWATGFHADVTYEGEPRYPDTPVRGPAKGY